MFQIGMSVVGLRIRGTSHQVLLCTSYLFSVSNRQTVQTQSCQIRSEPQYLTGNMKVSSFSLRRCFRSKTIAKGRSLTRARPAHQSLCSVSIYFFKMNIQDGRYCLLECGQVRELVIFFKFNFGEATVLYPVGLMYTC